MTTTTVTATDFKARCLDLFDQLANRKLDSVTVTKRGRPVAFIVPPHETTLAPLHGFMKGSVSLPEGFDLTQPVLDQPLHAEDGKLFADDA